MSASNAWVTLTTNDSYSLGALVLAHSLKRVGTSHELAVLVTPGVSQAMREQLKVVFDHVEEVDVLDSKDVANLKLLTRPELGITFTKLHCWRLVRFEKCVFLDADTLVLQNCDELFEKEEFSAAPDAGWPDCFNSGVFVYRPSLDTFNTLIEFALKHGSFDGGDQGLLNSYFADWATKDISKHLSFVYNMCSTATYSYLPALKQYGKNIKIIHFIGTVKPWLQPFNTETSLVSISETNTHLAPFLQTWWDIFCTHVHPVLSSDMAGIAGALSRVKLGSPLSLEQSIFEDHLRRQSWEQGLIDYMGRDSFQNIWEKICKTISGSSSQQESSRPAPEKVVEKEERPQSASSDAVPTKTPAPTEIQAPTETPAPLKVVVAPTQISVPPSDSSETQIAPSSEQEGGSDECKRKVPTPLVQPDTPTVTSPTPPLSPTSGNLSEAISSLKVGAEPQTTTTESDQPPVPPKRHQKKSELPKTDDPVVAATSPTSVSTPSPDTSSTTQQQQKQKSGKGGKGKNK